MEVSGTVREWHDEEGWGVIDSPSTAGGCWAHYSVIRMPGYKKLKASEEVRFIFEDAAQDGYSFRAVEVWTPAHRSLPSEEEAVSDPTAFHSALTIEFD